MKIFKISEVESVAVKKWGGMENLEAEQEKRKQKNSELESRIEGEKRHFWDREEIFEPLKRFMENVELPAERVSSYFKEQSHSTQGESCLKDNLHMDPTLPSPASRTYHLLNASKMLGMHYCYLHFPQNSGGKEH